MFESERNLMVDRFRSSSRRTRKTDVPDWEREAMRAEKPAVPPELRVRFNRLALIEALPELEDFLLNGHLEPPAELPAALNPYELADDPENEETISEIAEELELQVAELLRSSELPDLVAIVGRHHLGPNDLVKLRHPVSRDELQVYQEMGMLRIALIDDHERPGAHDTLGPRMWRKREWFTEQPDDSFRHESLKVLVEEASEHPEPSVPQAEPATRLQLISVLKLMVESDVVHREPPR